MVSTSARPWVSSIGASMKLAARFRFAVKTFAFLHCAPAVSLTSRISRLVKHLWYSSAPPRWQDYSVRGLGGQASDRLGIEYGREYWQEHQVDRRLTLEQLWEIGLGHRQREDAAVMSANQLLVHRYRSDHHALFLDVLSRRMRRFAWKNWQTKHRGRYDHFFFVLGRYSVRRHWDRSGLSFAKPFSGR